MGLLSSFSKLLEKLKAHQMFKYNILYSHQYGFLDKIIEGVNKDNPEYTTAIFLDLKKAFDIRLLDSIKET